LAIFPNSNLAQNFPTLPTKFFLANSGPKLQFSQKNCSVRLTLCQSYSFPYNPKSLLQKNLNIDFIGSCGVIDGDSVSYEEWIFAWSKLYVSDERVYERFFLEYENVCSEVGMDFKMFVQQEGGGEYDL
jgi:hypothetical protein